MDSAGHTKTAARRGTREYATERSHLLKDLPASEINCEHTTIPEGQAGVIQQIQPQQTVDVEEDVEAFDDMAAEYVNRIKNFDTDAITFDGVDLEGGEHNGSE